MKPGCPFCGSTKYHHIKTLKGKCEIQRGWFCDNCKKSFTSFEKFSPQPWYKKEVSIVQAG